MDIHNQGQNNGGKNVIFVITHGRGGVPQHQVSRHHIESHVRGGVEMESRTVLIDFGNRKDFSVVGSHFRHLRLGPRESEIVKIVIYVYIQ